MRSLTITVVALALAWSAYWFYAARTEQSAVEAWFAGRAGSSYADIATQGFPNRLDTSIEAPKLSLGPVTWSLPLLQLLRLSYTPGQYTLAFDTPQVLAARGRALRLASGAARASAVYDGDRLDRVVLTIETPRLTSDAGWTLTAPRLLFATRRNETGFEVGFDALRISLAGRTTDLNAIGPIVMEDGAPVGEIPLSVSDPEAFAQIMTGIGLRGISAPFTLRFAGGEIFLNDTMLGPAPRLP